MRNFSLAGILIFVSLTVNSQDVYYGMSVQGGEYNSGTIYEFNKTTDQVNVLHDFKKNIGKTPMCGFIEHSNGMLYTIVRDDYYGRGVILELDPIDEKISKTILISGNTSEYSDDIYGQGDFIIGSNGNLFTATLTGFGEIIEFNPINEEIIIHYQFSQDLAWKPNGSLVEGINENFYGVTMYGNTLAPGVLYRFNKASGLFDVLYHFNNNNGFNPNGGLVIKNDSLIYGTTLNGGLLDGGILFEYNLNSNVYTKMHDFYLGNNQSPVGSLLLDGDYLVGSTDFTGGGIFKFNLIDSTMSHNSLIIGEHSNHPKYGLIKYDDNIYMGSTSGGASNDFGGLFFYDNLLDTIYSRSITDNDTSGIHPSSKLIRTSQGKVFGLCGEGGKGDRGSIFKYDFSTESLKDIYHFNFSELGFNPSGNLIHHSNGLMYGMTFSGTDRFVGTFFSFDKWSNEIRKIADLNGGYLYTLNGITGLVEHTDAKIYGVQHSRTFISDGRIFSYSPDTDTFVFSYIFQSTNSSFHSPIGSLVSGFDGMMYGVCSYRDANGVSRKVIYKFNPELNSVESMVELSNLNINPNGDLLEYSPGIFVGTSSGSYQGTPAPGSIFQYDIITDEITILHNFNVNSGHHPEVGLVRGNNSKLYGVTNSHGNPIVNGALFEFDMSTGFYTELQSLYNSHGVNFVNPLIFEKNCIIGTSRESRIFWYNVLDESIAFNMLGGVTEPITFNSRLTKHSTLSIEEIRPVESIQIYPIPSDVNIIISGEFFGDVSIMDLKGKIVKKGFYKYLNEDIEIDLSSLESGVYFVQINKQNQQISIEKIVVN
jgi:uncharacterized repeat protein (TIGR03803 family)